MEKKIEDIFVWEQVLKDYGCYELDRSSETTNLTAFAEYADLEKRLTRKIFIESIHYLAYRHPYLRSAFKIIGSNVYQILLKYPKIPITFYRDTGDPEQWREVVKEDLSRRFTLIDESAWRVSMIQGKGKGQIFLTFHHAASDGLSAASAMNQLFEIMSQLMYGKNPDNSEIKSDTPILEKLSLPIKSAEKNAEKPVVSKPLDFQPCYTDFVRLVLSKTLTASIERYSKEHREHVTVHSLLYAAYIEAVKKIKQPKFNDFAALNIVSFRKELNAENVMRPLFTWLICDVDSTLPFFELACRIKSELHGKIQSGEHKQNVHILKDRLLQNPSPGELIAECKWSPNLINLSNIGKLNFTGEYEGLRMTALDAAGGCSPYSNYAFLMGGINISLAVRTFQGRIRMVANFTRLMADLQPEDANVLAHRNILSMLEQILIQNLGNYEGSHAKL